MPYVYIIVFLYLKFIALTSQFLNTYLVHIEPVPKIDKFIIPYSYLGYNRIDSKSFVIQINLTRESIFL